MFVAVVTALALFWMRVMVGKRRVWRLVFEGRTILSNNTAPIIYFHSCFFKELRDPDSFANDGVLARKILQEGDLIPSEISAGVVCFSWNNWHSVDSASWRISVWVWLSVDLLCERVENRTGKWTIKNFTRIGLLAIVIDIAGWAKRELETKRLWSNIKPNQVSVVSFDADRMARHLAEPQLNLFKRAACIEGLFLVGRDVLDQWWGVLLVGWPPAFRLLRIPRLERVVSVVRVWIVVPALICVVALVSWPVMLEVWRILIRMLMLSMRIVAYLTTAVSGGKTSKKCKSWVFLHFDFYLNYKNGEDIVVFKWSLNSNWSVSCNKRKT